ncbi:hypothetical protein KKF34_14340 [Myxococcota bacterium]|nr:hypothetical protein [Myxococcota bacterium]MBU1380719.1 hypothetical protein [Myxococcota bacterium]MBU1498053.1 hypothetical protein [Myxococcota bacterium]
MTKKKGDLLEWSAEITTDPDLDFQLYIEILYGEEYIGKIIKKEDGSLCLVIYEIPTSIPVDWLLLLFKKAKNELK